MHPSFNIRSGKEHSHGQQLFIYAGWQGIAAVTMNNKQQFDDIVCWHFQKGAPRTTVCDQMKAVLTEDELFRGGYGKTDIIFQFPDCILTPHEVYNSVSNDEMLDLVFGDLETSIVKTDFLFRHNVHAVYRVPAVINNLLQQQFPLANYSHIYALLPDAYPGDGLFAFFSNNDVIAMLRTNGQLQVIQTFVYTTPEDAAWHLLNVCRSFGADVATTVLNLFGMLDEDAALYREIYKYFLHTNFGRTPENFQLPAETATYPEQYFSHLLTVATCV